MKQVFPFFFAFLATILTATFVYAAPEGMAIEDINEGDIAPAAGTAAPVSATDAGEYTLPDLPTIGAPTPKQLGFQQPSSPIMEKLDSLHDFLTIIAVITAIFVMLLLAYVCFRFRRKANPVASKTTHNTLIEIIWTAVPVLILVVIGIKSLPLHYEMDRTEKADMTLKVTGNQWFWTYEYPDNGGIVFESRIIRDKDPEKEKELLAGRPRLLAVDNPVVIPVDTTVRLQLTAADVIHAWAMPALGVKIDAVPGRLNETWFRATKTGIFYGQCSELCGVDHGFMPIALHVVSKEDFAAWSEYAKTKFADGQESQPSVSVAAVR